MAESTDSKKAAVKKKRKLRAPSESVRERAVKAQEATVNPVQTRRSLILIGFLAPLRLIWRGLAWLSHRPPLKQLGHGLRWFFTRRPVKFVGKVIGVKYIISSFKEVKLVTWPGFRQSLRLTKAVIIFSIIFGAIIASVDYGLDKIFKQIILK